MSGYVPVFGSLFQGSLHGRWPDVGLWLAMLALADRHGRVDCTPQYIASVTGLSVSDVTACIDRFLAPDAMSRTRDHDGRRLELIDPERPWGWKILNHGRYREKARLMSREAERVASGANAERMRRKREAERAPLTPDDPRQAPVTHPQIETETLDGNAPSSCVSAIDSARAREDDTHTREEGTKLTELDHHAEFEAVRAAYPEFAARQDWIGAEHHARRLVDLGRADWPTLRAAVERYAAFVAAGGVSGPQYVLAPAKFFGSPDEPWAQAWTVPVPAAAAIPHRRRKTAAELEAEEQARASA